MGERPEFECRRPSYGEDRGADEGGWGVERGGTCEESGMWDGCPAPHWGAVPPPEKNRFCISNRRILVQIECFWKVQVNHLSTDHK